MKNLKKIIWGIILTGGESKRMGTPKSLLKWGESTLIEYQVNSLIKAECDQILIITGKHHSEISKNLNLNHKSKIIYNENHNKGKSTSIKKGIKCLPKDIYAVMILAVDQPRPYWVISKMIRDHIKYDSLLTSPINNNNGGHPLIFSYKLINELEKINEKNLGLRKIFNDHKKDILKVNFNSNIIRVDINNPDDYKNALDYYKYIAKS